MERHDSLQYNEWKFLSQLGLAHGYNLNDLDMLGKCEFYNNHPWEEHNVPSNLNDHAIQFIHRSKMVGLVPHSTYISTSNYSLSHHQQISLSIITNHSASNFSMQPLYMVIQGTARTRKSYLISCIRNALCN